MPRLYVNYALFGTPLGAMYGEHLERLREIKKRYNPEDVWDLQADGNSMSDSRAMFSMTVAEIVCWRHHDHL